MQSAKEKLHILYQLYEKPMYHIAYAILHHTQQTEDAVSEAFCKVIRHLDKIGDPESPRTKQYIIRIIRNTAINQYRKNAREADRRTVWDDRILQIPDETAASPAEQQEEQQHQQAILTEMLESLSETDRQIVLPPWSWKAQASSVVRRPPAILCQNNLPFREIAQRCGIKEAAARKRFERARKTMMKQKGVTSYEQLFPLS